MLDETQTEVSLSFGHRPQSCSQGKSYARTTESTISPLLMEKVVNIGGGGQNEQATETREYSEKELSHFVDWYHQLPKEPLLRWTVRVFNLGAVSLVLMLQSGRVCWVDTGPLLNNHRWLDESYCKVCLS